MKQERKELLKNTPVTDYHCIHPTHINSQPNEYKLNHKCLHIDCPFLLPDAQTVQEAKAKNVHLF